MATSSKTGIGQVRGLGSSNHGAGHWITQRVTAVGNLVLMLWLLLSFLALPAYDYEVVRSWIASPLAAVPLLLLVLSVFWHFRIGMQVLIEDYIHNSGTRFGVILLLNFYAIGGGALAIYAILRIAFSGEAF